jgi:hypothetical protein
VCADPWRRAGWGAVGACDEPDPGVVLSGAFRRASVPLRVSGLHQERPCRLLFGVRGLPPGLWPYRPLAAGRPTSAECVEETLSCTPIASARADMRNETLHRPPPPAWIRDPAAGHGKADWKRYLCQRRGNRCRFGKDRSHRDMDPSMMVIIDFRKSHVRSAVGGVKTGVFNGCCCRLNKSHCCIGRTRGGPFRGPLLWRRQQGNDPVQLRTRKCPRVVRHPGACAINERRNTSRDR